MGVDFSNGQTLSSVGGYVVASEPIESYSYSYAPSFHMGCDVTSPPTGAYILFDKTYFNSRGLYSSSNGRFTAPIEGMYWFFFSAMMRGNSENRYCSIRKNGSSSWELRVYTSTNGGNATHMSGYKLFYLNQGDFVSVYNVNADIFGGGNYTYFCGGLMQ